MASATSDSVGEGPSTVPQRRFSTSSSGRSTPDPLKHPRPYALSIDPITLETVLHGSCPECHHWHSKVSITIGKRFDRITCERCGHDWFGIGGQSTTHETYMSQETIANPRRHSWDGGRKAPRRDHADQAMRSRPNLPSLVLDTTDLGNDPVPHSPLTPIEGGHTPASGNPSLHVPSRHSSRATRSNRASPVRSIEADHIASRDITTADAEPTRADTMSESPTVSPRKRSRFERWTRRGLGKVRDKFTKGLTKLNIDLKVEVHRVHEPSKLKRLESLHTKSVQRNGPSTSLGQTNRPSPRMTTASDSRLRSPSPVRDSLPTTQPSPSVIQQPPESTSAINPNPVPTLLPAPAQQAERSSEENPSPTSSLPLRAEVLERRRRWRRSYSEQVAAQRCRCSHSCHCSTTTASSLQVDAPSLRRTSTGATPSLYRSSYNSDMFEQLPGQNRLATWIEEGSRTGRPSLSRRNTETTRSSGLLAAEQQNNMSTMERFFAEPDPSPLNHIGAHLAGQGNTNPEIHPTDSRRFSFMSSITTSDSSVVRRLLPHGLYRLLRNESEQTLPIYQLPPPTPTPPPPYAAESLSTYRRSLHGPLESVPPSPRRLNTLADGSQEADSGRQTDISHRREVDAQPSPVQEAEGLTSDDDPTPTAVPATPRLPASHPSGNTREPAEGNDYHTELANPPTWSFS